MQRSLYCICCTFPETLTPKMAPIATVCNDAKGKKVAEDDAGSNEPKPMSKYIVFSLLIAIGIERRDIVRNPKSAASNSRLIPSTFVPAFWSR